MIWHERDGQKHVGHPGGLPGLRHADALGARARAERHPARQRHLRQVRDAAAPRTAPRRARGCAAEAHHPRRPGPARRARCGRRPGRALGRRRGRAPVLAQRRSRRAPGRAARRARGAGRVSRGARARRRARARGRTARPLAPARRARPRRSRRSPWRRPSPRSSRRSALESVLPPAGLLATLATAAVDVVAPNRAAHALGALLAPAVDAAETLRGFQVAAALDGPFGDPEPVAGDGATTTTLRLPSDRGAVDLELELDADSGRLARAVLRPAAPEPKAQRGPRARRSLDPHILGSDPKMCAPICARSPGSSRAAGSEPSAHLAATDAEMLRDCGVAVPVRVRALHLLVRAGYEQSRK